MVSKYTSVKLRTGAKKKLEELQARLRLRGVKVSLYEILEKLIEIGLEQEDVVLEKLRSSKKSRDPMQEFLEKPIDWSIEDASVRIDEALYGGRKWQYS
ncbi:MAG: hypothetical protein J7K21_07655 [Desulfurococcales archaeon]|nr:hypothetical protein [Desulfurococcales archaeon]